MKKNIFYTQNNRNSIVIGKYLLLIILITLQTFTCFAQVEVKWTKELPEDILWQEVTALGNLIVSSDNQLVGIDPETGEIRWSKQEHAGLYREAYNELPNSPFFTVTTNNSIHLIDPFSGDEVFDSYEAGMSFIKDYFLLYNSDAILVAGKGIDDEPLMMSVKMSDGMVSRTMKEKFGRIIAATELGNNELLLVTLFNNYKLNASTGTIIWKEVNSPKTAQTDKLGALGDLMKAAAETLMKDVDNVTGQVYYCSGNRTLISYIVK